MQFFKMGICKAEGLRKCDPIYQNSQDKKSYVFIKNVFIKWNNIYKKMSIFI